MEGPGILRHCRQIVAPSAASHEILDTLWTFVPAFVMVFQLLRPGIIRNTCCLFDPFPEWVTFNDPLYGPPEIGP